MQKSRVPLISITGPYPREKSSMDFNEGPHTKKKNVIPCKIHTTPSFKQATWLARKGGLVTMHPPPPKSYQTPVKHCVLMLTRRQDKASFLHPWQSDNRHFFGYITEPSNQLNTLRYIKTKVCKAGTTQVEKLVSCQHAVKKTL